MNQISSGGAASPNAGMRPGFPNLTDEIHSTLPTHTGDIQITYGPPSGYMVNQLNGRADAQGAATAYRVADQQTPQQAAPRQATGDAYHAVGQQTPQSSNEQVWPIVVDPNTGLPMPETLQMNHGLPQEVIVNPVNAQEAFVGSIKNLLGKNVGHYVVASFLVGTQEPVSWQGFLHDVGNDYITIFQPDMGRYVTGDLYSLKFIEFHDHKGVVPACVGIRRRDGARIW